MTHSAKCDGSVSLSGDGLASILSSCCSTCGHSITLQTSDKVKGPRGYRRWECNLAAVWGQMTTGGGRSQLEETMSIVGSCPIIQTKWWKTQSMKEAREQLKEVNIIMVFPRTSMEDGVSALTNTATMPSLVLPL